MLRGEFFFFLLRRIEQRKVFRILLLESDEIGKIFGGSRNLLSLLLYFLPNRPSDFQ